MAEKKPSIKERLAAMGKRRADFKKKREAAKAAREKRVAEAKARREAAKSKQSKKEVK